MKQVTYWVEAEHTLLYKIEGMWPGFYGVLQGKLLDGGRDWKNGICCPARQDLRPATIKDFETFRVCPSGYDI